MKKLYFYTSQDGARDIFTSNFIGASGEGKLTVGTVSPAHLYLTHKKYKLSATSEQLSSDEGEFPVAVELTISEKTSPDFRVEFVTESWELEGGNLSDYDESKHIGCFLSGVIPFVCISKILFESEEDKGNIYQPSPDLWIPADLIAVIEESSEFSEVPNLLSLVNTAEKTNKNTDHLLPESIRYSKRTAGIYFALTGTKEWMWGEEYQLNIDPYAMKFFGGEDCYKKKIEDAVASVNPDKVKLPYDQLKGMLSEGSKNGELTDEVDMHKAITSVFLNGIEEYPSINRRTPIDEKIFSSICSAVYDQIKDKEDVSKPAKKDFELAKKIFTNDAILVDNLPNNKTITALLIVLKYPHNMKLLSQTLEAYHIDQETARLSLVYFGLINGMTSLVGEGYKDNYALIWRISEAVCKDMGIPFPGDYLESYKECIGKENAKLFNPIVITCKHITPQGVIRTFFTENWKLLLESTEIKDELKKEAKKDTLLRNYMKKCMLIDANIVGKLTEEEYDRRYKEGKKNKTFDGWIFYDEYLKKELLFRKLVEENKDFWDTLYQRYKKQISPMVKTENPWESKRLHSLRHRRRARRFA